MKINQRGLKTGLKMTSKSNITTFTIFGVVMYLLTFLGITLTTTEAMAIRKILIGCIGGAIFSGILIIAVLRVCRYFIMKFSDSDMDIQ
jgi:cyanate permease